MNSQYQPTQGHGTTEQAYYAGKELATGHPPQAAQQQFAYANGYNNNLGSAHPPPPAAAAYAHTPPSAPASSGVKRSQCLALLATTLVLLAAVIGLAAGLGVSQRNLHTTQADLDRATRSPSAATTVFVTATAASTGTHTSATSSSASATATADTSNITCPGSNNTLYTADTGSKQFRQYCGIDYGDTESQAVGSVKVSSMDACMDACAAQSNCTGAGWGYLGGDTGNMFDCYMKANLTASHSADHGWAFGILLTDSGSSSRRRGVVSRSSWRA